MNWLHSILILGVAYLAVFFEARFQGFRDLLGTQIDLLPSLMVYTGLTNPWPSVILTAVCGGLWFDSFSANPLGVSVLPLLVIGLAANRGRELLWNDHFIPQFFLGTMASAFQFLAVLFLLFNIGVTPIVGWKSIWQWLVVSAGGGVFAPVCFKLFKRIHFAFVYPPAQKTVFPQDRQIKRGRS